MAIDPEQNIILRALLEADGGFVSGSGLAERMGVSRVSVRARMQKLEESGFKLEAIRNKGYRLASEPQSLHADLLDAYLTLKKVYTPVHAFAQIDSTNNEAERLLSAGHEAPFVVFATHQSAGRGRMGRVWVSQSSENLYLSFAFRPQLPPARMTKFTLWMGASLCNMLDEQWHVPAQVKWPNDLLCGGRKLAGMLTEARIDSDTMRDLIFGLGLNVNGDPAAASLELRDIATSMSVILGKNLSINAFAADVITCLLHAYDAFIDGSYENDFKQRWIDYDCLNGQRVKVSGYNGETLATVAGLNDDGSLAIQRDDGSRIAVRAGDVSLTTRGISS